MSLTIETELKEVLEGLNRRFDKFEQKLDKVQSDITDLKTKDILDLRVIQIRIEGELKTTNSRINNLDDKFDLIQKSVDKVSTDLTNTTKDISDLKGVKSLIVPAFVAIFASLLTLLTSRLERKLSTY